MALNNVVLQGRLVADPEKRMAGENEIAEFRIAVDRDTKEDKSDFINVVAWRQNATYVNTYLAKGAAVLIKGSLRVDQWKDKETEKTRERIFVEADRVYSISRPKTDGEQPSLPDTGDGGEEQAPAAEETKKSSGQSKRFF